MSIPIRRGYRGVPLETLGRPNESSNNLIRSQIPLVWTDPCGRICSMMEDLMLCATADNGRQQILMMDNHLFKRVVVLLFLSVSSLVFNGLRLIFSHSFNHPTTKMTLITRLGAALIVLAATLPFAAATAVKSNSCKSSEFW